MLLCCTVEVTLDPDTANPALVLSEDCKRMQCGLERREVPHSLRRFDGWWCCLGSEGFSSGRRYWEVEVGNRDWRLGVAKESALRKGYRPLNTQSGYLYPQAGAGVRAQGPDHTTHTPSPVAHPEEGGGLSGL